MPIVNIHEAKTQLSKLLQKAAAGEEVIIAKAGTPIARLVPCTTPLHGRRFGKDQDLFEVPEDFDAPLPDEMASLFRV